MEEYKLTNEKLNALLDRARVEKVRQLDAERSSKSEYEYELQLSAYERAMRELKKTFDNTKTNMRDKNE